MKPRVVPVIMIGTALDSRGGIACVVRAWRELGLFQRWPVEYIATHAEGSALHKLAVALRGFLTLLTRIVRVRHAVLHVHGASRASFWRKSGFMAAALAARWPLIFHLHGGGFARFYQSECGPFRRAAVRFILRRTACVVVVSESWARWMRGIAGHGRIVCVPQPVDALEWYPSGAAREAGLVAFLGGYAAGKGFFDLLAAFAQLRRHFPAARLECAGEGDAAAARRYVASVGHEGSVRCVGWLDRAGVASLLARASIFVLPSHAEGLPMSLLEAMASGCPVVATAVGGIPDVIQGGRNGLLVTPGDREGLAQSLARLLGDDALARRLAQAGRDTVLERFEPRRGLETLAQVYTHWGVEPRVGCDPLSAARLRHAESVR